jgi:hypothetical protein
MQAGAGTPSANRKALVIGNGNYQNLPKVPTSGLDVKQVGSALKSVGFEVTEANDVGIRELTGVIEDFTKKIAKGDVAFVYYSGLAVQSNQENYILPVDFSADKGELFTNAYSVSRIDADLYQRGSLARVLVLDSCHDIPQLMAKYDAGLATPLLDKPGVLIAFSAQPGRTIVSKQSVGPGLFAKEIAQSLTAPGLSIEEIFRKAQDAVGQATAQAQIPTYYPLAIRSLYLKAAPATSVPAVPNPDTVPTGPRKRGRYDALVIGTFTPQKGVNVPPKVLQRLVPALTEQLSSWNLREIVTEGQKPVTGSALKIEGTITSYTSGSRMARLTVGYGVGTAKVVGRLRLIDAGTGKVLYQEENVHGFVGGGVTGGRTEDVMNYFAEAILIVISKSGLL